MSDDETIRVPVDELYVDNDPGPQRGELYVRGAEHTCPTCGQEIPGGSLEEALGSIDLV